MSIPDTATGDILLLMLVWMIGFAVGALTEWLRERWVEYRLWNPKGKK